jgi:hypothetical protein
MIEIIGIIKGTEHYYGDVYLAWNKEIKEYYFVVENWDGVDLKEAEKIPFQVGEVIHRWIEEDIV